MTETVFCTYADSYIRSRYKMIILLIVWRYDRTKFAFRGVVAVWYSG